MREVLFFFDESSVRAIRYSANDNGNETRGTVALDMIPADLRFRISRRIVRDGVAILPLRGSIRNLIDSIKK